MRGRDDILHIVKRTIVKTLLWSAVAVFAILASIAVVVQLPYFQTRIVQKLSQAFSESTGFATTIGHVSIKWFDTMVLDEVHILDKENKTMIRVGALGVDFDVRALFRNNNIYLDEARLIEGSRGPG